MRLEARLASLAQRHADDMAAHGFFDMRGSDGSNFAARVRRAGYAYQRIAEHLAVGYPTPATVVAHWIERRESRRFLLDATLTEAGIGYAKAVPARLHQVATRAGEQIAARAGEQSPPQPNEDALDHYWVLTIAAPTLPAPGSWHDDVLRRVNEFRAHHGLAVLKPNVRLDRAAQSHTDDMARRGYFSHVAPDGSNVGHRAQRAGYDWKRKLENIAAGQTTAEEAVEGWIHSDHQRRGQIDPNVTEAGGV